MGPGDWKRGKSNGARAFFHWLNHKNKRRRCKNIPGSKWRSQSQQRHYWGLCIIIFNRLLFICKKIFLNSSWLINRSLASDYESHCRSISPINSSYDCQSFLWAILSVATCETVGPSLLTIHDHQKIGFILNKNLASRNLFIFGCCEMPGIGYSGRIRQT